jgi:hypothetical protein
MLFNVIERGYEQQDVDSRRLAYVEGAVRSCQDISSMGKGRTIALRRKE